MAPRTPHTGSAQLPPRYTWGRGRGSPRIPPSHPKVCSLNRRPQRQCSEEVVRVLRCFAQSTAAPAARRLETALAPPEAASGGTTGRNPRPPPGGGSPYLSEEGRPTRPTPPPRASASASHSRPRGGRFQLLVSAPAGPNAHPALPLHAGVRALAAKEEGLGPEPRPPLPDRVAQNSIPAATAAPPAASNARASSRAPLGVPRADNQAAGAFWVSMAMGGWLAWGGEQAQVRDK